MSQPITRERLLAQGATRTYLSKKVNGETYRFQSFSEAELCEIESSLITDMAKGIDMDKYRLRRGRYLVNALVDENGDRLFKDGEEAIVMSLNAKLVRKLYEIAMSHCDEIASDKDTVEQAEKN